MRMKLALLAGSILVLPAVAGAQPIDGLYVGVGVGANLLQNETVKRLDLGAGGNALAHSNPKFAAGFAGLASIGYGLGNGLRVEMEGNYRSNQVRGVSDLRAGGHEQKYGAMLNALYDFDASPYGLDFMLPYVGVGAGWMQNDWSKVHAGAFPAELTVNKAVNGLAVQGILGAAFPMTSYVPGLDFTLEYRIMAMPNDRKYTAALGTAPGFAVPGKLKVSDDINHSILIGFRYGMAPPPPPPPAVPAPVAAPAPAPSRTYLVFFDWDKADLTERARQIISQAAQNSTRVTYTRIEVAGHADRTGTPQYNQRLSMRRAETVASELVKDGVPQNAIDVQAYGDTRPLVPTAAGVREPQNRRVEIVLK